MTNRQECRFGRPQVARRVAHKDVRHQIEWLEDHVGGAVPIGRLQSVVNVALGRERKSLAADCGPRDVTAQPFEFGALIGGSDHAGVQ